MGEKPEKLRCCNAMTRAQEEGTDSEGFGPLVNWSGEWVRKIWNHRSDCSCEDTIPAGWEMGHTLPPIRFCPWCGTKIEADHA